MRRTIVSPYCLIIPTQSAVRDGYTVSIVQNPTISLADDVAVTKRILAAQDGPAILVGHSYGGVVIIEAGNDPKVAGLAHIAAFPPRVRVEAGRRVKRVPASAFRILGFGEST